MRYIKFLSLAAIATAVTMAFIGMSSASATVFCSTTTTPCNAKWPATTVVDFSLDEGTSIKKTTTDGKTTLDTCTGSTKKFDITNPGNAVETVTGVITDLTWSGCSFPTKTTQLCAIEFHNIAGTDNATVTADGECKTTINTVLFGSCVYGVIAGTHLGVLTGTTPERTRATLDTSSVWEKESGSEAACPATAKETGTYILTEPTNTDLYVEPS